MSIVRAHDKLVGRSLGEFVLRERIGEGGFGAVYRANQPALDREAVIKVLHGKLHASAAAQERFLREAKLASKLDHPFAAHIYAFGAEPDGELWIAMELVRGTPLDQVLKIQGPIPPERFVPLLDRICEVVHAAHEQGIVHRDIKPANVMVLSRAGRLSPKLLDFGIAKGLAASSSSGPATDETIRQKASAIAEPDVAFAHTMDSPPSDITQRGVVMGSPPYMAPEQWLDAGKVDARTDLYALGILAYECLTGKPPFTGTTLSAIATAHASQAPPPVGARLPAALDKVFGKVLAKEAADRFADALAFAAAFRQASGVASEALALPAIEPARRDAVINGAPQPIAEAVAAFEAARNVHQARDAIVQLARTVTRYVGLLALACRSRVAGGADAAGVSDAIRALCRRSLADREWLELARGLTQAWRDRRDAYPIPELIDALDGDDVIEPVLALLALREVEAPTEDALHQAIGPAVERISRLLDALAFLDSYPLVLATAGGIAERWMGVRRDRRMTVQVRGKGLPAGVPALLDQDGAPVLSLSPLFQVTAPTPGAPLDLFLFDGRDRRGAKLVALPSGFEHHDDGLWDWFRVQLAGSVDDTELASIEEKPPYRGLSAFSAEDGAMFYGRENQVDAFVNRLRVSPLLAVVGRSGAGKSSFVHAGVIPSLPAGWRAITLRPGGSPISALAARLEHAGVPSPRPSLRTAIDADRGALGQLLRDDAAARGPLLLVIDQLEEMFTLCQDADDRRLFAEAVSAAARDTDDPVRVVFTLRDDFLVRTEQIAALRNRIGQGLQLLTVPAAEDLLRIVVEPARRAGYELDDPQLAAEMVKEVADQPGALALISFTAAKLWELRDRHFKQLTRSAYKSLGGVGGALAQHAEQTLDGMPPEERALTREAFRHLVTTQNTRAVLARKELRQLLGASEHADGVMEKLVTARLLVASENESGAETIEIVHEALLSAWPRLVEWRREDAEGARFREQLRSAAKQWDDRGRPRGLLWRGDPLGDYSRWRARHAGPLTDVEAAFADASLGDAARGRRNVRLLIAAGFAVLVAVVVGLIFLNTRVEGQRVRAESAAADLHDNLQHQYENQGRRFVLEGDPLQALAYLAKAGELGAHGQIHDFLVAQALQASDGELFEVHHDGGLRAAQFSADGTRLLTASDDHTARIWDAHTGKQLVVLHHEDIVFKARLSPDDRTVLTASFDGTAALWDAATGAQLRVLPHHGRVNCAAFSSDGKLAVTAGEDDMVAVWEVPSGALRMQAHGSGRGMASCAISSQLVIAGDGGGTIRIWNASSGQLVRELAEHHGRVLSLTVDATQNRLASAGADGNGIVWDLDTGRPLHVLKHDDAVRAIQLSPDGRTVLTGSSDRTAVIWDAATGAKLHTLAGHAAGVFRAAFSPDGQYVVTGSEDATACLWESSTGRLAARWRGHGDVINDIAFDPASARVVSASVDATAIVWRVAPQERTIWLRGHTDGVNAAQFSPDGNRLVTGSYDGTARVWDASSGVSLATLSAGHDRVDSATFSPDGASIATAGDDGVIRIWDATTFTLRRSVEASSSRIEQVAWSPAGSTIVEAGDDGMLRGFDVTTGTLRFATRGHGGAIIYSATFAPGGNAIVTAGRDRTVKLWNLTGGLLATFPDPDQPTGAEFDPGGTRIMSVVFRQQAKIWSPIAMFSRPVALIGHVGLITTAAWSTDGSLAITASFDGTARIWSTETGDLLATFTFPGHVQVAAFSRDRRRIVIGGYQGQVQIHDLPQLAVTQAEIVKMLRCRVPFEVDHDQLRQRPRDRTGCDRRWAP